MGSFLSAATGTNNGFQAQAAPIDKQDFSSGLTASTNQFNQAFRDQGNLANQLQGVASGHGPNPAQIMLNQATNRAIQQGSGMISSQKGISPALAQRLAAQFGAQQSQQAAGQGALMGAQQQLGALGQLQGLYGQQQQGALGMNQNLQSAQGAQNNALVGMQSNLNNSNLQSSLGNQGVRAGLVGGVAGALGGATKLFAHGGMVQNYADGGIAPGWGFNMTPQIEQTPTSQAGQLLAQGEKGLQSGISSMSPLAKKDDGGGGAGGLMAGGPMDEMGGGGGGLSTLLLAAKDGGKVPGKASVKGDSQKNDTQPALLSPGEIVIPRHITMSPNAPALAAKFVELELARHEHEKKMACGGMAGKYADGGEVPSALSANPPTDDITQMPSQFISGPPAQDSFGPEQYAAQMAQQNPGLPQSSIEAGTKDFAEQNKMPYGKSESVDPGPDQGPANMPQSPSAPAKSGSGGGGIDQYLNARQDLAHQATLQDVANTSRTQQQLFNLDTERQNIQNDIKQGHVDPSRLFNNMGTGEKIKTTIGLILGGIGSGLTGKSNVALDLLNKHIDNDIKSQEADMQKNQNLLSANFRQTGDVRMASEMTRMMQKDLISDKLQEVENNAQDPVVRQRAQLMRNQLALQNAQTSGQLQMWSQMQGQQPQNLSPADKIRRLSVMGVLPKEDKQQADKELGAQQRIGKLSQDVEGAAKLLDSKFLAGKLTPASRDSAVNTFAGILAKEAEGRFNLEEAKNQMSALLPAPGDLPSTRQEKAVHRKQFFDSFNNYPVLEQYKIGGGSQQQGYVPKTFKASK